MVEIVHRNVSQHHQPNDNNSENDIFLPKVEPKNYSNWTCHLRPLCALAVPLMANSLVTEVQYICTISYIGKIGTMYIGAYVLGNMLCNITGYSLAYGACSALDTLISQAYGGRAYMLVGLHAQRSLVILSLFAIPVATIWSNSEYILQNFLFIDPPIAKLAGQWSMYILPSLWPQLGTQVLRKYLQGCGIVWPAIVANIVCAVVNICANSYFIDHKSLGFRGAGLAVVVAQWSGLVTTVSIITGQIVYARMNARAVDTYHISGTELTSPRCNRSDGDIELGYMNSVQQTLRFETDEPAAACKPQALLPPATISAAAPAVLSPLLPAVDLDCGRDKSCDVGSVDNGNGMHGHIAMSPVLQVDCGDRGFESSLLVCDSDAAVVSSHVCYAAEDSLSSLIEHDEEAPLLVTPNAIQPTAPAWALPLETRPFSLDQTVPPCSIYALFQNWMPFLVLAAPGAISLFLEWGSFELMAGLAGQLGEVPLATHGIYMTTCGLLYMIPQSLADATATLAGNHLGNGSALEATQVVMLGMVITTLWGICSGVLLFFILRPGWGAFFTEDDAVRSAVYDYMPIMFLYVIVDASKCIALNVLRSTGRPGVTAWGNVVSCLVVMLPLGWLWSIYYSYDLYGIWGAMCVAWLLATGLYVYCILSSDWDEQVAAALKRNKSSR